MGKAVWNRYNRIRDSYFSEDLRKCLKAEGLRSYLVKVPYLKKLNFQKDRYLAWITKAESHRTHSIHLKDKPLFSIILYGHDKPIYFEQCLESINRQTYRNYEIMEFVDGIDLTTVSHGEYILFLNKNDTLEKNALYEVACRINEAYPDFIYTDEDRIGDSEENRFMPFFKPDWSPDTFLSFFYTGSLCIIKKKLWDEFMKPLNKGLEIVLYSGLLAATEQDVVISHIDKVLYHRRNKELLVDMELLGDKELFGERDLLGDLDRQDKVSEKQIKEEALKRRGVQAEVVLDEDTNEYRVRYKNTNNPLVSIVIPSKDNAEMLLKCIGSILSITEYRNYEIIIIDNGSKEEVKRRIESAIRTENISYYYQKMDFNFSKMCNMGAAKAKGEYLLFLNDDMEILHGDWLEIMVGHAGLTYVGAVGAKLLYPGNGKIQHLGITNMISGPSHKCILQEDSENIYFGRNRLEYNYLAVTGACLLLSRNKFFEVGGFDESLKIRYNDVDICASLYEKGYYNVSRMDVTLYHYESVSRGLDEGDNHKLKELADERKYLYRKHPLLLKTDSFYNRNLSPDKSEYIPDYLFDYEKDNKMSGKKFLKISLQKEWINGCVNFNVEQKADKGSYLYLEGWAYVRGEDNAKYTMSIVLEDTTHKTSKMLQITTFRKHRKDLKQTFKEEKNIELAGFVCRIPKRLLQENSTYKSYILIKAKYSRQVLAADLDVFLEKIVFDESAKIL